MRGYDPVEVDTFLEMLGKEFEKLLNDKKISEHRILELETELKNYKEVERTLKETLMNMQETSNKSRENVKKEADLIRKEAELAAAKMMDNARRERQTIKEELITLQTQKKSLIARLRHVLTSQLELMDVLELEDTEVNKLKDRSKKVFVPSKEKKQSISESQQNTDTNPKQQEKQNDKSEDDAFLGDVFPDDVDIENLSKD
jgi:cell division initiation protein